MQKYKLSSRILHWLMAAVIIFLLGLGIYMADFVAKDAPNRLEIYNLHKSFGVLALILILLRIANRAVFTPPSLPETINKIEQKLAHLTHFALYLLMIIVPISGYLMSNSFGYPVKLFGLEMPFLIEKNATLGKIFHETHEIAPYILIAVLALHILGAIKHRFCDANKENDVLRRII